MSETETAAATAWLNSAPALLQSTKKRDMSRSCAVVVRRPARGGKKCSVRESEFLRWDIRWVGWDGGL